MERVIEKMADNPFNSSGVDKELRSLIQKAEKLESYWKGKGK